MAKRKHEAASRPGDASAGIGRGQWEYWKRKAAPTEYVEASLKLLNSAGKMTRQAYLEQFLEVEEKYPGRGWKEQMDELEAFYFKQGLSLKEFPRSTNLFENIEKAIDSMKRKA